MAAAPRRGALAAGGVLAAVAAVVAFLATSGGEPFDRAQPGSPAPTTQGQPASPAAGSRGTSAVPAGRPERIRIPAIGVDAPVAGVVSTHDRRGWTINPPEQTLAELRQAYWWSEHAPPADPSAGTSYIYGHACTRVACTFNDLRELAPRDLITVTTARGVLNYRVVGAPVRLAKTPAGIGSSSIYDYGVVNRLVLITCGYTPDGASPLNWVVIAQLVSASRAP